MLGSMSRNLSRINQENSITMLFTRQRFDRRVIVVWEFCFWPQGVVSVSRDENRAGLLRQTLQESSNSSAWNCKQPIPNCRASSETRRYTTDDGLPACVQYIGT